MRVVHPFDDDPLTVDLQQIEEIGEAVAGHIVAVDTRARCGRGDVDARHGGPHRCTSSTTGIGIEASPGSVGKDQDA